VPRPQLSNLVDPKRTALVTQECQVGVVGTGASLVALATEAQREALPNIIQLLPVARAAGVQVIHCTIHRRSDGVGANSNARLFASAKVSGNDLSPGSEGASILPELGPEPEDLVLTRYHGVGPMGGTDLDAILRNLGVTTIVGVGVSVNIAIPNLVMDAVNAGYQVVLPRDAVAGVPREYAEQVIENSLSLLATVTNTQELLNVWTSPG
jgi:nicotinamidase-related amidase